MTHSEYQKWMSRAFLYVEAALAMELAAKTHVCMTEEYLRTAMVRGLFHSEPAEAERVSTEWSPDWSNNGCWKHRGCGHGQGRPLQHDIGILKTKDSEDAELACEVKWLKHGQNHADVVIQDLWKLMLSRSVKPHGKGLRCYLLVGGEGKAFEDTFAALRRDKVRLQWRSDALGTTEIDLAALATTKRSSAALGHLLSRGEAHFRTPPECLSGVLCICRGSWYRTLDKIKWRMGLWELTSWGAKAGRIDWEQHKKAIMGEG